MLAWLNDRTTGSQIRDGVLRHLIFNKHYFCCLQRLLCVKFCLQTQRGIVWKQTSDVFPYNFLTFPPPDVLHFILVSFVITSFLWNYVLIALAQYAISACVPIRLSLLILIIYRVLRYRCCRVVFWKADSYDPSSPPLGTVLYPTST